MVKSGSRMVKSEADQIVDASPGPVVRETPSSN